MIHRSSDWNAFEFVRVSALRAAQLMRGCTPRVPASHRSVITAQMEVAQGFVKAETVLGDTTRAVPAPPSRTPSPLEPVVPRGRRS